MKIDAKHVVIPIVLPVVLIAGLVLCAWQYKNYALAQIAAGKDYINSITIGIAILFALLLGALFFIAVKRIIIEHEKARLKYIQACVIDPLTGLFNKKGFEAEAGKALSKLPQNCASAIVTFEVVSFRTYNELYGYEAGDALLKMIAEIACKFKKSGDVVSRMYSDHFVWLISGEDSEEIYSTLKNALRTAKNTCLPFYLCGGIFHIDNRKMSVPDMVDKASIAKDTIKYNFGTGIAIYNESMLECQLQDAEMVGSMMKGLQNGEFIDYYQPKYKTDSETIIGAEALVRWKKPDGEIITPGRFIGLFERNGFIRRLDFYMFERVCCFLAKLQKNGEAVLPVSVNFSRVHMHDLNFPQRLLSLTQKYGVDPKFLEIELTESAFVMETKDTGNVVDKLHEYGFLVAIDDFGSGFSSLNMLKDFEFDTLKIDIKFLEGFELGGKVGTVVTSVIRMAKWLGIPVVAEGVETREQIDFLRTLGCEMIQGYYYSRPIPREEYEKLLERKDQISTSEEKSSAINLNSINSVLGGDSLVTSILDGILGGFGIYELSGKSMEAIRVNRTYYEMMGYPDAAAFREHSLNVVTRIYPPDVDGFFDAVNMAVMTGNVQKITARRYNYFGKLMQFDCLVKHIGGTREKPLICMTIIDAVERLRIDRENELNKYCDALHGIFDEIFEFNYNEDTLCVLSKKHVKCNDTENLHQCRNLKEAEKNWLENIIHPDDRGRVEKFMLMARTNEIELPFSSDYRVIVNGEIRWISASLVSILSGSYLLCNLDITQKKRMEMLIENIDILRIDADQSVIAEVFTAPRREEITAIT